jgi:hypothetical protein
MNADERGFKTRRLTDLKSAFISVYQRPILLQQLLTLRDAEKLGQIASI